MTTKEKTEEELSSLTIMIFLYFCLFIPIGIAISVGERTIGNSGCQYKSYLSVYNPAFSLGCELARDRTK